MPPRQTHKSPFVEVYEAAKRMVFYCTAWGGCAVATIQQMKKLVFEPVVHIGGGFSEWK